MSKFSLNQYAANVADTSPVMNIVDTTDTISYVREQMTAPPAQKKTYETTQSYENKIQEKPITFVKRGIVV